MNIAELYILNQQYESCLQQPRLIMVKESLSELRKAQNEVFFRQKNESIQKSFDDLKKIATESGQTEYIDKNDRPLHFLCECSDENCKQRVVLKPSLYNKLHKNRKLFVMVCGHESPDVERVVKKEKQYCAVEKFIEPPKSADKLNITSIANA